MLKHSNVLKLVLQAFSVTSEMNRPSDSISDVCKTSNNTAHRNHESEVFNSQYTVPALFKIVPPSHNQKSVVLTPRNSQTKCFNNRTKKNQQIYINALNL